MPGYIDEQVKDLIINQLTREEYQDLKNRGLVQRNQIYLFPDATEEDIELIKEKLRELIEAHNELTETVENIDERLTVVEEWIESQGSEGSIYTRLDALENAVNTLVREIAELNNLLIYCGTSTDDIGESSEV